MPTLTVERDTEILIDNQLRNLGWDNDPHSKDRNVYQQRVKTEEQKKKLKGKRPDYILYESHTNNPIAVIEAKKPGQNIREAIEQGRRYAERIDAPIVFATDGIFTKTLHIKVNKPLKINGEELDELVRESLALQYLSTSEVNTLDKKVIKSRGELISIFDTVNDLLREEGMQQGLERFTEFSNILFLKVLSEIEDGKELIGEKSRINNAYRWNYFKNKKGLELLSYVSDTVLKWFAKEYNDENIFQPLQIKHPDNLKEIINLLDDLQLTDINADVKGDAFEYFIRSYSASNPSDLGEIFTPRHVVKTMVKLLNPEIGETIYDPFCGTGGMLIVAYKHLISNMPRNERNLEFLKNKTIYGADITKASNIAKMNMILAGDGHSNIVRQDSLANPIDNKFDIVITNMPFAQKTRYGDKYTVPNRSGDIVCPQHCFRALKPGGRMAIIVPDGFLSNTNQKAYENVRRYLTENANLKSIISLPRGAFEPYNRAKASILYFTDVKKSKTKNYFWFFTVKNDGYTLDKKREKIEGPNDLELVLSENNLEDQKLQYLMSLGIDKIDFDKVKSNNYALNAVSYREFLYNISSKYKTIPLGDIFELSGKDKIGNLTDAPIMSITMAQGLIDQNEKFNKRIASKNISKYKKVYKNELVVGFPIDEGVLGFQTKYPYAAVSPAYTIWKLKKKDINVIFLGLLLRSYKMREIYKMTMQGSVDRRRSIPKDIFLKIRIPIPPMEVQNEIVKKQNEIDDALNQIKISEQIIAEKLDNLWNE
ncbi:N-6 DNA methylase [Sporanaerobacter acetigenes]|uniref:N-6 DNA methylase n=1 Tax=Sporanaerobacter acetigenes TaxID=165813 RepID=UPI001304AFA7|nr:N-6 DNA methylase [Sporanaerobacter acetigenes]